MFLANDSRAPQHTNSRAASSCQKPLEAALISSCTRQETAANTLYQVSSSATLCSKGQPARQVLDAKPNEALLNRRKQGIDEEFGRLASQRGCIPVHSRQLRMANTPCSNAEASPLQPAHSGHTASLTHVIYLYYFTVRFLSLRCPAFGCTSSPRAFASRQPTADSYRAPTARAHNKLSCATGHPSSPNNSPAGPSKHQKQEARALTAYTCCGRSHVEGKEQAGEISSCAGLQRGASRQGVAAARARTRRHRRRRRLQAAGSRGGGRHLELALPARLCRHIACPCEHRTACTGQNCTEERRFALYP